MKEKPKNEKIIIPKGRKQILKKVLSTLKKEDKEFKSLMDKLPTIQTLPTHYYCYVPYEYARKIVEMYKDLHYEEYGYVD